MTPLHLFNAEKQFEEGLKLLEKSPEKAYGKLLKAAEKGFPEAQFKAAECLLKGRGVSANREQARLWMQRAAKNGHVKAQMEMGGWVLCGLFDHETDRPNLYEKDQLLRGDYPFGKYNLYCLWHDPADGKDQMRLGIGGSKTEEECIKALAWYDMAANAGDSRGAYASGCLRLQLAVQGKDSYDKAAFYMQLAAGGGLSEAQYIYGWIMDDGLTSIGKKRDEAISSYRKAAENRFAPAMRELGLISLEQENTVSGDRWLKAALDAGDEDAAFHLGCSLFHRGLYESSHRYLVGIAKKPRYQQAKYELALMSKNGWGTKRDVREAERLLREYLEAKPSSTSAMLELAEIADSDTETFSLVKKAFEIDQDSVRAIYALAKCHDRGIGTQVNRTRAVALYEKAAEKRHAASIFRIAQLCERGEGCAKNNQAALENYQKAANLNHPEAQHKVGEACRDGLFGSPRNEFEAYKWLEKSAMAGFELGQLDFGRLLESKGRYAEAFSWYEKAAEQGNERARYLLGKCYELGRGTEADYAKAVHNYDIAARQGCEADAWIALGDMCLHGKGIQKDAKRAVEAYNLALQMGNNSSFDLCFGEVDARLGECYELGLGVDADTKKAFEHYQLSAKKGSARGKRQLAHCYETGIGVDEDVVQARSLYKEAMDAGDTLAKEMMDQKAREALGAFERLVGLEKVKESVRRLSKQLEYDKARRNAGFAAEPVTRHMLFLGSPGTGKTTVARLMGDLLFQMGVTRKPVFADVTGGDLISSFVNDTAGTTRKVFERAYGGVLFIDEAYQLKVRNENGHESEALTEIVKLMEEHRDDLIVIMAGYENEMRELLKCNPGLPSRFPRSNWFIFEDYNLEELLQIFDHSLKTEGYEITDGARSLVRDRLAADMLDPEFGNGRGVRGLFEEIKGNLAVNFDPLDPASLNLITERDVPVIERAGSNIQDTLDTFDRLVGLEAVKKSVRKLSKQLEYDRLRRDAGLPVEAVTRHMLFLGSPGTGKTTVARLMGDLLFQMGVTRKPGCVEVTRADLVGAAWGKGLELTKAKIEQAMGGVLFVDEAYALKEKEEDGLGQEVIDTLMKAMEDHRDDLVVIMAGYEEEMEEFLKANRGLKSRFPDRNRFIFEDYSLEDLLSLFDVYLIEEGYRIENTARALVRDRLATAMKDRDFGNGRGVRELLGEIKDNHVSNFDPSDPTSLTLITDRDVLGAN